MPALTLKGPVGPLEAFLDRPEGEPKAVALLCHPHPPSGGTLNTHGVFRAMRALRSLGCVVLRFNFRGVGKSAGIIGDGEGERDDARAACGWLTELQPGLPLVAGGFSFGSWVGMTVGVERGASALIGLGTPYAGYDFRTVAASERRKAFVLGDGDQFTAVPALEAAVGAMQPPARLWVIPGTSHLFTENLDAYETGVREAGHWLLE